MKDERGEEKWEKEEKREETPYFHEASRRKCVNTPKYSNNHHRPHRGIDSENLSEVRHIDRDVDGRAQQIHTPKDSVLDLGWISGHECDDFAF